MHTDAAQEYPLAVEENLRAFNLDNAKTNPVFDAEVVAANCDIVQCGIFR